MAADLSTGAEEPGEGPRDVDATAVGSLPARRLPDEVTPFGIPGTPGDPILRWASTATTVDGIGRELARIWALPQAIAAATGAPERTIAARTSVLNLVVVCASLEVGSQAAATISMLTGRHPSRTLLLIPADPDGPGWLKANVKAYCMVPRPNAPETCAELIEVLAGGDTGRHLGSIVAPLLVHDLPVALWWPGDPPLGSRLARDLFGMADRLIVDGSRWSGDGIERLRFIARSAGPTLAVSDFALLRQARWREAVATVFDLPEFLPYVRYVRRISVTYGTLGGPDTETRTNIVKPIHQVAWLASRLGMRVVRPLTRAERSKATQRRAPAPGAAPDAGRGLRALLAAPRGGEVEVVIRPVISEVIPGTTLRVEILAERRGTELRAEVTAEAETVHVRVWEDGVEALDRSFLAARRTDADLLAEAVEVAGRNLVSELALRTAGALVGEPDAPTAAEASRTAARDEPGADEIPAGTVAVDEGAGPDVLAGEAEAIDGTA